MFRRRPHQHLVSQRTCEWRADDYVCVQTRQSHGEASEPSEGAKRHAENIVNELERELALDGYVRAVVKQETQTFKHTAPSTGKGPAVRAETGDAESDAAAQAIMNHVSGMPFNTPCGLLLTLRLCLHRWSLSRVAASTPTTWSLPG